MKYKKFIVFQFYSCYPSGGIGDITGSFDDIDEAIEFIKKNPLDYEEVVDRDTWEVVPVKI